MPPPPRPPYPGWSAEALLVLLAARPARSVAEEETIEALLRGPLDWENLQRLADSHAVGGLVHRCLEGHGNIPRPVRDHLRRHYERNRARNLVQMQELIAVLRLLDQAGIEAIPFKGPLLAKELYEDLGLRWIADLDLLARPGDLMRIKPLLLERGYEPDKKIGSEADIQALTDDWEYGFNHPHTRIRFELHWRFMPEHTAADLLEDRVWREAVPAEIAGVSFRAMPRECAFLYACVHGGDKHSWADLRFLIDLARMMDGPWALDWKAVAEMAAAMRRERSVATAVLLASDLLGATVPAAALALLPLDARAQAIAALARGRLFRPDFGLPGLAEWRTYLATEVPGQRRPLHRSAPCSRWFHYARAVLEPEWKDRAAVATLAPHLSFARYLYRLLRLFGSQRGRLWGRLR